jgi:single-strand DNA-binding protein
MSQDLNRAMFIGRLGADPELRFTQGGRAVLNFRMATSEQWVDDKGEKKESTQWHTITLWGKRAEPLSKYLAKGSRVYVEGRVETREYDDKEGIKRKATEINATDIKLLDGKRDGAGAGASNGSRPAYGGDRSAFGVAKSGDGSDDDVPFAPLDERLF